MRIAYVASPKLYTRGASSIEVMRMAEALGRYGYDVDLIIPYNSTLNGVHEYYGVEPLFGIKTLPAAPGQSLRHIVHGLSAALYTSTRRGEYDLVLSRSIFFALISARLLGMPTIFDAHHPMDNWGSRWLFEALKRSRNLVRFVAISEGIGDMCVELGLPPEKLTIAPNGFNPALFHRCESTARVRKRLRLPETGPIISHIGNIYSGRGIDHLIDAARELPEAHFLIVGGEEEDIELYRRRADSTHTRNVHFTGFIPPGRVPLYFTASDILVLPYTTRMTTKWGRLEANFASLLKMPEYMASRKPIVATDIPAISATLTDEENAILVRPDSPGEILGGIRRALSDPALATRIAERAALDSSGYSLERRIATMFEGTGFENPRGGPGHGPLT